MDEETIRRLMLAALSQRPAQPQPSLYQTMADEEDNWIDQAAAQTMLSGGTRARDLRGGSGAPVGPAGAVRPAGSELDSMTRLQALQNSMNTVYGQVDRQLGSMGPTQGTSWTPTEQDSSRYKKLALEAVAKHGRTLRPNSIPVTKKQDQGSTR